MVSASRRRSIWLLVLSALVALIGLILTRSQISARQAAPLAEQPGTWTAGPVLGTMRTEVAAAVQDGVLYVVGQYTGSSGPPGANEAYDPGVGRWEARAALPADLDHACGAVIDGRLYVVGGFQGTGGSVASLYAYDPAARTTGRAHLAGLDPFDLARIQTRAVRQSLKANAQEPTQAL